MFWGLINMVLICLTEYLFANCSSFSHSCYGVSLITSQKGGEAMWIIIFMIGTYGFNIILIVKAFFNIICVLR